MVTNDFDVLVEAVNSHVQGVRTHVDVRDHANSGESWVDFKKDSTELTVSWMSDRGFGFYPPDAGYGEKPNKVCRTVDEALTHIKDHFSRFHGV